MAFVPYVPLTVGRGVSTTFTTYGHPGVTQMTVLLTEAGDALVLESGDFITLS